MFPLLFLYNTITIAVVVVRVTVAVAVAVKEKICRKQINSNEFLWANKRPAENNEPEITKSFKFKVVWLYCGAMTSKIPT